MLNFLKEKIKRTIEKRKRNYHLPNDLIIGKDVSIGGDCFIDSFCWLISIGNHAALASRVQIIAHDASTKLFLGYDKIDKVIIGDDVFIGQNSIIAKCNYRQ